MLLGEEYPEQKLNICLHFLDASNIQLTLVPCPYPLYQGALTLLIPARTEKFNNRELDTKYALESRRKIVEVLVLQATIRLSLGNQVSISQRLALIVTTACSLIPDWCLTYGAHLEHASRV